MASNLIDTLNENCAYRNCKTYQKKTSDIFLSNLICDCNCGHTNPCGNCVYYTSDYTKSLATGMLCDECLEKLINKRTVFETIEQIKNYVHGWDELCTNCKKNTSNHRDLIDYMELLITKVDSLTKEVDDIKKFIGATQLNK